MVSVEFVIFLMLFVRLIFFGLRIRIGGFSGFVLSPVYFVGFLDGLMRSFELFARFAQYLRIDSSRCCQCGNCINSFLESNAM